MVRGQSPLGYTPRLDATATPTAVVRGQSPLGYTLSLSGPTPIPAVVRGQSPLGYTFRPLQPARQTLWFAANRRSDTLPLCVVVLDEMLWFAANRRSDTLDAYSTRS